MSEQGGQNLGKAEGRIVINTQDLARIQALSRQVGQIVGQNLNQINRGAKTAQTGINDLTMSFGGLSMSIKDIQRLAGIGGGIFGAWQVGKIIVDLAQTSAQADRVKASFNSLATGAGQSGEKMLASMRTTSKGMIADTSLILSANKAMLLGVADNGPKMAQLLDVARVRGQAMGLTTEQAFNDVVTGLGRMSPLILDNLGIQIKGKEKFFDVYAAAIGRTADSLSDAEKKAALFNEVMNSTQSLIDASAGQADSAANKFERVAASWDNAKKSLGDFILALGAGDFLDVLNESLRQSNLQIEAFIKHMGELKQAIAANVPFANFAIQDPGVTAQQNISERELRLSGLQAGKAGLQEQINEAGGAGMTAQQLSDLGGRAKELGEQMARQDGMIAQTIAELDRFKAALALANFKPVDASWGVGFHGGGTTGTRTPDVITAEQTKAITDWAVGVRKIEADANSQRLAATAQYESQRAGIERSYQLNITREAQDFGIKRGREAADLSKQIADIGSDSAKQTARWAEDLADSIAKATRATNRQIDKLTAASAKQAGELTEDSNKRLAQIEEDYHKASEKAARDHRDNLINAAASLDAMAVFQEQKRFAQANKEAGEAHKKAIDGEKDQLDERLSDERQNLADRIAAERESLAERIDQDRAANTKRLADAALADAERIADAKATLAAQQKIDDENRALTATRAAEDFQRQLAELATQQAQRLTQIAQQEAATRQAHDAAFNAQLEALGRHNAAWLQSQKLLQAESLRLYKEWLAAHEAALPRVNPNAGVFGPTPEGPPIGGETFFTSFEDWLTKFVQALPAKQAGGQISRTGLARIHAGENILSPATNALVSQALGANYSQAQLVAALAGAGGRSGPSIILGAGAIQVYGAPGQSEAALAVAVRNQVVNVLKELG